MNSWINLIIQEITSIFIVLYFLYILLKKKKIGPIKGGILLLAWYGVGLCLTVLFSRTGLY